MLLALSSNQKLGLALAAAAFVVFALVCAMLIPRYRPNFPAGHLGWFIAACGFFTAVMLLTVFFVARESEHEAGARDPCHGDRDSGAGAAARADGDGRRPAANPSAR